MKCPKCGFNSFESYDVCKKCSSDLVSFKQIYSITPLVLPLEVKEKLAAELKLADGVTEQASDVSETHDDMFSFDLPDEAASSTSESNKDPFDFIENTSDSKQSINVKSEDDIFANLLESSPTIDESPFAETALTAASTPAKATQPPAESGEFGLENFSWDDSPAATVADDSKESEDDFDSLFGDTNETTLK